MLGGRRAGGSDATVPWVSVRNYQARNVMCDAGGRWRAVLPLQWRPARHRRHGAGGVHALPDPTQFAPKSPYYDLASKREALRWLLVDIQVLRKTRNLALPELRAHAELQDLLVLRKSNRLSITPVEPQHWRAIVQRLGCGL